MIELRRFDLSLRILVKSARMRERGLERLSVNTMLQGCRIIYFKQNLGYISLVV